MKKIYALIMSIVLLSSLTFAVSKPKPSFSDLPRIAFIMPYSIIGPETVEPGSPISFNVDLVTTTPDTDCGDGYCSVQYGLWAIIDSNQNIVYESQGEEITGSYHKNITFNAPTTPGKYLVSAIIEQYDWSYSQGWSSASLKAKDANTFNVRYSGPSTTPQPVGFTAFLSQIWNWLIALLS